MLLGKLNMLHVHTRASRRRTSRLNSADLPTLGRPMIDTCECTWGRSNMNQVLIRAPIVLVMYTQSILADNTHRQMLEVSSQAWSRGRCASLT